MKHIRRVVIENFQSHAHSELEFGSGLNVIIGPSDNGKSAVLRAIRWALYNEPRGSEFVRSGARECRVTVTMSDGAEVVRELLLTKSGAASRNRYIVRLPGAEEQVFEGFGHEVPAEVTRAHGMPQVLLDTDKRVLLSFGSQLEGAFLLAESGSLRARAIGRLLGVHVVDAAVRNTQRDLRSVKGEVSRLERELERYDHELEPYANIPEQEAALEQAEAKLAEADALTRRLQQLERITGDLDRTERESIMVDAALSRLEDLAAAEQKLRAAEERYRHGARLERLAADLDRVGQESHQYRVRIDALTALPMAEQRAREAADRQARLSGLERIGTDLKRREKELAEARRQVTQLQAAPQAGDLLEAVAAKLQRLEKLQAKAKELADVAVRSAKGEEMVHEVEADLSGRLTEYERVLRHLGRCPTCMQPVPPAAIKRILAELAGGGSGGHNH